MKKLISSVLITAALAAGQNASAAVVTDLQLDFASGASFEGTLTFSDNYDSLLDVSGLLTGGGYGSVDIHWAWWLGTGQNATAVNLDGNPATYEDWLMDGVEGGGYSHYIGISWLWPVSGTLELLLSPEASVRHAGINDQDAIVAFNVVANQVPEPGTVALLGLGLAGLGFSRRFRA